MTPHERLSEALGDQTSVSVPVSYAGGRTRYVRLLKGADGAIHVELYGIGIAHVRPTVVEVSTRGFFTPSTRDALSYVVAGLGQSVSMRTPGSRGGKPGPHSCTVHYGGSSYVLTEDRWTSIPTPKS